MKWHQILSGACLSPIFGYAPFRGWSGGPPPGKFCFLEGRRRSLECIFSLFPHHLLWKQTQIFMWNFWNRNSSLTFFISTYYLNGFKLSCFIVTSMWITFYDLTDCRTTELDKPGLLADVVSGKKEVGPKDLAQKQGVGYGGSPPEIFNYIERLWFVLVYIWANFKVQQ